MKVQVDKKFTGELITYGTEIKLYENACIRIRDIETGRIIKEVCGVVTKIIK